MMDVKYSLNIPSFMHIFTFMWFQYMTGFVVLFNQIGGLQICHIHSLQPASWLHHIGGLEVSSQEILEVFKKMFTP